MIGNDLTLTFPEIGEGGPPAAVVEVDTETVSSKPPSSDRKRVTLTEYGVMHTFRLMIGGDLTFTFPEIGEWGPPAAVVEVDTETV